MVEQLTEELKAAYVAALLRELEGYERVGDSDHAAQVSAELARLGADAAPEPAKRPRRDRADVVQTP